MRVEPNRGKYRTVKDRLESHRGPQICRPTVDERQELHLRTGTR